MAAFFVSNSYTLTPLLPHPSRCIFPRVQFRQPPAFISFPPYRKTSRGARRLVTRAGPPTTTTYIMAFVFPLSLILITVITSIRVADKLDQKYLEELEINEAIREADEEEEDDDEEDYDSERDDEDVYVEKEDEPDALQPPRTRNRPKKELIDSL